MADGKYGHLYTEADVRKVVNHLSEKQSFDSENIDGALKRLKFTFPADEPMFLIRAKDRFGLAAVRNYRTHAFYAMVNKKKAGFSNFIKSIDNAVDAFEKFRIDNADKMKDPD